MKIINQDERRAVNAILFFVNERSMRHLFKTKMFKLLALLDFIHFNQTGRTVTGETYKTFPRGPVPIDLYERIDRGNLTYYFNERLMIKKCPVGDKEGYRFVAIHGVKPNLKVFSEREIEILEQLAYIYKDATADQMTEATHLKNSPWEITKNTKGLGKEIDIMLALDGETEITKEIAEERLKIHETLKHLWEK